MYNLIFIPHLPRLFIVAPLSATTAALTNYGPITSDTESTLMGDKFITSLKIDTSLWSTHNKIDSGVITAGDYSIGNYNGGVQPISKAT